MFSKKLDSFFKRHYPQKKEPIINEIDQMNEAEFKELLYHLFKQKGYYVKYISNSNDRGADLFLSRGNDKVVVQAIHNYDNIEISVVNEIASVADYYKANDKWIITNRHFTEAATLQANKKRVRLINQDELLLLLKAYNTAKIKIKDKVMEVNKGQN
ncbi:restriction endonuclease [Aquibacillus halophilus]|nr:restriction endonuclease [Aquibacillus halophilus]